MMEQIFLKIRSDDPTLPDFISAKLGNRGAVYVPFSRFRQTLSDDKIDILLALDSENVMSGLHRILRGFIESKAGRVLTLERENVKLTLKASSMPSENDFIRQIAETKSIA